MDLVELVNFPVSGLLTRYGIKKSQLYERFKQLGIVTHLSEGKAYVTTEQLTILDSFNQHIFLYGSGKEFVNNLAQTSEITLKPKQDEIPTLNLTFIQPMLILEEYAQKQWLITSRQLAALTGSNPSRFYGKSMYNYRGFILRRVKDSTRESTWQVSKINM